jgi:hypothetical protein
LFVCYSASAQKRKAPGSHVDVMMMQLDHVLLNLNARDESSMSCHEDAVWIMLLV